MITQTCAVSEQKFLITDGEAQLCQKMDIPLPDISPIERRKQRLSFRNEWKFFRRKCDGTGKTIISMYPQDVSFPVYEQQYWWGDGWDSRKYGRDFDFSRPFFEQFGELLQVVPRICLINAKSENSLYTNYSHRNKNCYMGVGLGMCEESLYTFRSFDSKFLVDCAFMLDCEWCYECTECEKLYECVFSHQCSNSRNLQYCFDCRGCQDCFGCWNLVHKSHCIFNEQYSPEAYEKKIQEMPRVDRNQALKHVQSQAVFRASKTLKCENVTGDNMVGSKNCTACFDGYDSEDCSNTCFGGGNKDCHDVVYADNSELNFQSACLEDNYDVGFTFLAWYCSNLRYCMECFHSQDLFGCIGMRRGQYAIFNRQYTVEEYEKLRDRIIAHMKETGEWGNFFPVSLSPFAYNQTIANEHWLQTKEAVLAGGGRWVDESSASKYIGESYQPPADIADVDDLILEQILICQESGKHYKVQKSELDFYRKMHLPIPRIHPDVRRARRMASRTPRELFTRRCSESGVEVQSTFSPDRPEKILCEECYLEVVN